MSDQNRRRRTKTNQSREEQVKRMRIGIGVGIAAVVLLIVFLLVRGTANSGEEPTGTEGTVQVTDSQSETGQEDALADNSQYNTDFSQYELQENAYPEINQLLGDYFQAKVDQDPEALYRVFGKTDMSDVEERRQELEYEARFIQDYEDITCYTKPGMTEDSYVVYVTFKVKYKRTDTLAPGLLWCYVVKNGDSGYIIRENVLGDEADYVARMNQTEDVKLLSSQINQQLREALESDTILASYYQEMRNGAIVYESEPHDSTVTLVTEPAEGESESQSGESDGETAGAEDSSLAEEGQETTAETADSSDGSGENAPEAAGEETTAEETESGSASEVRIG